MNVAITGSNGLIGSRVVKLLKNDFNFIPLPHSDLDITNQKEVVEKLNEIDFDILLHLAAYTDVDGTENNKSQAYDLNVNATKHLFEETQKLGKKMIYLSTDFVFDGKLPPYDELSTPHPIGCYGQTKFEGEEIVKDKAMIVRISYPYGISENGKADFVERLKKLLKQNKQLTMITDAAMTPTFIDDIAGGLSHLMKNFKPEIYHLVGRKTYTPFEIGKMIAKAYGRSESLIMPTTFQEYGKNKSPRPQYSIIMTSKNTFQPMKKFEEGVNLILNK